MNTIPHPASSMKPKPARVHFPICCCRCLWTESVCQWCGIEVARSLCVGVGAGAPGICRRQENPSGTSNGTRRRMRTRSYPQNGFLPGPGVSKLDPQGKQEAQHILVLWLKEQDLGSKPLHELTCLVSYLKDKLKVPPSAHRIVGPCTSGTLSAMLEELKPTAAASNRSHRHRCPARNFILPGPRLPTRYSWMRPLVSGWPSRSRSGSPLQAYS